MQGNTEIAAMHIERCRRDSASAPPGLVYVCGGTGVHNLLRRLKLRRSAARNVNLRNRQRAEERGGAKSRRPLFWTEAGMSLITRWHGAGCWLIWAAYASRRGDVSVFAVALLGGGMVGARAQLMRNNSRTGRTYQLQ